MRAASHPRLHDEVTMARSNRFVSELEGERIWGNEHLNEISEWLKSGAIEIFGSLKRFCSCSHFFLFFWGGRKTAPVEKNI